MALLAVLLRSGDVSQTRGRFCSYLARREFVHEKAIFDARFVHETAKAGIFQCSAWLQSGRKSDTIRAMKREVVSCAAAALAFAANALTVTLDRPSPAAERDFAYHLNKMGAAENVSLKVAEHPYGVMSGDEQAFRLRIAGDEAWISGRTPEAVAHGVYELLERMGCDWVMPGEIGEVIPQSANPRPADCDVEEAPSFRVRCPWMPGSRNKLVRERGEYDLWKTRKKLQTDSH